MEPTQPTDETSKDSSQTSVSTADTKQPANQEPRESDIEREKLELDKQRLKLEIEAHETAKKLDFERITLEKSKERTAKLQIGLPILVSILALFFNTFNEYRRSEEARWRQELQQLEMRLQAEQNFKDQRLELFKKMAQDVTDATELKKLYSELFPQDAKELDYEKAIRDKRERESKSNP
jgi:hypothetical protein